MNVAGLAETLSLEAAVPGDGAREVTGGYCGDLLSWVMSRLPAGGAWFTVMGNANAVAVASLADAACIVLCEGAKPDAAMLEKARAHNVAVLLTGRSAYDAALALGSALQKEKSNPA